MTAAPETEPDRPDVLVVCGRADEGREDPR